MFRIKNLDHLVLTVTTLEIACKFYEQILGMRLITFGNNRKALCLGEQKINLHELGKELKPNALNAGSGTADLCFIVDNPIIEIKEKLLEKNINLESDIIERTGANGKIYSIYIRDPDGNLIELSNYIDNILCWRGNMQAYLIIDSDKYDLSQNKKLEQTVNNSEISCVMFRNKESKYNNKDKELLEQLVSLVHKYDKAFLIQNSHELVKEMSLDGLHITGNVEDYNIARKELGEAAAIGVEINNSRHDAMIFAEQGADYLAFSGNNFSAMCEWWHELFNVPCVAITNLPYHNTYIELQYEIIDADFIAMNFY